LKGELKPVDGKNLKAAFEYAPAAGSFSVFLCRKIEVVPGKLSMDVRLVPRNGKGKPHQTKLQKQASGQYRADRIKLLKGEWTLSLVGRRNSEVQFLLEHVVRVD
jgi:hypothetical protein